MKLSIAARTIPVVRSTVTGLFSCLVILVSTSTFALGQPEELLTVAERSQFKTTSLSSEVVDFVDLCASKSDLINKIEFGTTVDGKPMIAAVIGGEIDQRDDKRPRILLLGNIHSGECAGKEALLQLLRELTLQKDHPWLEKATIVIVPNYNADGNDRVGKNEFHRPGQVGPENGMGVRENAQQLDLNRDFIKLESPEARSLVGLIDRFDPHLFIDCHTTNGSKHRYELTYDVPHNLSCPEPIRTFLRNKMMPAVTANLTEKGTDTFYYGNLSRDKKRWFTFGHEPRYSTEYVGLRGRLAILAEAYSYISYEDRIKASHVFVSECVNFLLDNSDDIINLLDNSTEKQIEVASSDPAKIQMHLSARPVPFEKPVTILGYEGDQPKDLEVEFVGKYEPTRSVPLPFAYVIDDQFARQVDRLKMHGIEIQQLSDEIELEVAANRIDSIEKREQPFQGHRMVTLQAKKESATITFASGTYIIQTNQPLGRLASYLLEPTSDDGLVTWNFFDPWLSEGELFPIYRIEDPTDLETTIVESIEPKTKLGSNLLFGESKINFSGSDSEIPTWSKGKNAYQMTWHSTWSSQRVEVDAATGGMTPISQAWSIDELESALNEHNNSIENAREIANASKDAVVSDDGSNILFHHDDQVYLYQLDGKKVFNLSSENKLVELAEFSPNGKLVAFVQEGNLYLFSSENGSRKAITSLDGTKYLSGKLDWAYQEELYGRGNFKGFWWSPDSSKIAFLQLDVTGIKPYTIKDNIPVESSVEISPYPKAGEQQPVPKIAVYDTASDKTVFGNLNEHEDKGCDIVISRVTWHPESKQVAIQVQNRQQTFLDLALIDHSTGQMSVIFRDQTPAWIESPGDPIWIDSESFLWMSPRKGTNQVYKYSLSDKKWNKLTNDKYGIQSILGYRKSDQTLIFASKPDGIRQHIFSLNVLDPKPVQLTSEAGNHTAVFSDDFNYFFDVYSTHSSPSKTILKDATGEVIRAIDPNIDDTLKYLNINQPEFIKLTLGPSDGETFETDAIVIKPPQFDPSKKYPVLYHVYSGPQAPTVRDQFRGSWYLWHQLLAQNGYVVFMCDNRSATHKGAKDAWPIHRKLGTNELEDIELAVDWLKSQDWVDESRLGIWGWSYGGYMTAFALTHSQSFKAGISGAPVTDWRNYDSIYTERYMGTPQDNPEGYESSSVVAAAENLHGKLLLIHGSIDDNVHISNTMQLVYALQNAGKPFDLMIYPKNRHGIRREPQVKHLQNLMTRFILENL